MPCRTPPSAAVCGTVGSSVVVSEQSQVINAGPGRCLYAADAGACCDLCAMYPTCAAWFFNTAPGWECDEGDQGCESQQQVCDSVCISRNPAVRPGGACHVVWQYVWQQGIGREYVPSPPSPSATGWPGLEATAKPL